MEWKGTVIEPISTRQFSWKVRKPPPAGAGKFLSELNSIYVYVL
jgi:hypothetical protein